MHFETGDSDIEPKYTLKDVAVREAGMYKPVLFSEKCHLDKGFENSMQRTRYFAKIQLSITIDVLRYCPGGSHFTVYYLWQIDPDRQDEELTQIGRIVAQLFPLLPEFHTRQMRKEFKRRYEQISHISPSVMMDASAPPDAIMRQRLRLIMNGEPGLLPDLRKLNSGRPGGTFEQFFEKMGGIIEEATAAAERRHNVAHLAHWISIRDLMTQTKEIYDPGTLIPSPALVRLQFSPRNPYTHAALSFTSRFKVQYKIQVRQLRTSHPDNRYCAAQLKYFKKYAVDRADMTDLYFCDDKAKVSFGEPGHLLSTGVRGRESLVPKGSMLGAEDHDVHKKGSITPSVYMRFAIPECSSSSFVRGNVTVMCNDAVFQSSNPFRHATSLVRKILRESDTSWVKPVLMKFTDGGADHRCNLESVKCSLICIFKHLDLDMLIAVRCSPGQSWINPTELVMSVLNLALQNCSLEREKCTDEVEAVTKNMKALRTEGGIILS